jgi:hypothetical protein
MRRGVIFDLRQSQWNDLKLAAAENARFHERLRKGFDLKRLVAVRALHDGLQFRGFQSFCFRFHNISPIFILSVAS